MSGPPSAPQSFQVGAPWPFEHCSDYAELHFQRLAKQSGFVACVWHERKQGLQFDIFECKHHHDKKGYCTFVVRIAHDQTRSLAYTAASTLQHNHNLPNPTTNQYKEAVKKAQEVIDDIEREIKEQAAKRFLEIKAGDSYRQGSEGEEHGVVMTRRSQQEHIVWDLKVALGDKEARGFEQKMREQKQLVDAYPIQSTLDLPAPFYIPAFATSASSGAIKPGLGGSFCRTTSNDVAMAGPSYSSGKKGKKRQVDELEEGPESDDESFSGIDTLSGHPPISRKYPAPSSPATFAQPETASIFSEDGPSEHSDDEVLVLRFKGGKVRHIVSRSVDLRRLTFSVPQADTFSTYERLRSTSPAQDMAIEDDSVSLVIPKSAEPAAMPAATDSSSPLSSALSAFFSATAEASTSAAGPPPPSTINPLLLDKRVGSLGGKTLPQMGYDPRRTPSFSPTSSASPTREASLVKFMHSTPQVQLQPQQQQIPLPFSPPAAPSTSESLRPYLHRLGIDYDPPFADSFAGLASALVATGITTAEQLEACAVSDLDELVGELGRPGQGSMLLKRFKAALVKRVA
ncbi:hypothetical protein JCM11641_000620 [Rhodosporidiobolus odoratus]